MEVGTVRVLGTLAMRMRPLKLEHIGIGDERIRLKLEHIGIGDENAGLKLEQDAW